MVYRTTCALLLAGVASGSRLLLHPEATADVDGPAITFVDTDETDCTIWRTSDAKIAVEGCSLTATDVEVTGGDGPTSVSALSAAVTALQQENTELRSKIDAGGHRYWRIRADSTPYYAAQWHAIAEIEYYARGTGKIAPSHLATLPHVGQINARDGAPSDHAMVNAYDGTTSAPHSLCSMTSGEDGTFGHGLDFGEPINMLGARVYGPNDYGIHYQWSTDLYLESSDDGVVWQTSGQAKNVGSATSLEVQIHAGWA